MRGFGSVRVSVLDRVRCRLRVMVRVMVMVMVRFKELQALKPQLYGCLPKGSAEGTREGAHQD